MIQLAGMLAVYFLLGICLATGFAVAKFITVPIENFVLDLYTPSS